MTIDVHCHDFPDGVAARAMAEMCAQTAGVLWPAGDGTLANHLDHLELAGVDRAVLCPIATKPRQFDFILRRARAIRDGELGERARRLILPLVSVHPRDPDALRHLDEAAAAGIRGVKFHCYYQDFSLADPSVWPIFGRIADLGLVAECHAGADVSWRDERGRCGPDDIATLLANVPGLRFVAVHLGGCDGYPARATDVLLESGCYVDTSSLHRCWSHDEEMRLLRSWPRERILFGTDFPWVHYPEAIRWVKSVRDPADWDLLFGENARRLFRLDQAR